MKPTGTFLGIPYDWRAPTIKRIKYRAFNPHDPRVFTPKVFGAGWTINWPSLLKKLKLSK